MKMDFCIWYVLSILLMIGSSLHCGIYNISVKVIGKGSPFVFSIYPLKGIGKDILSIWDLNMGKTCGKVTNYLIFN